MSFTGGFFDSWIIEVAKIQLGLSPLPVAADTELLLFDSPTPITSASVLADITGAEIAAVNGYARYPLGYVGGDVAWDGLTASVVVASRTSTLGRAHLILPYTAETGRELGLARRVLHTFKPLD